MSEVITKGAGWTIEHSVRSWVDDCGCVYTRHDVFMYVGNAHLSNASGASLNEALLKLEEDLKLRGGPATDASEALSARREQLRTCSFCRMGNRRLVAAGTEGVYICKDCVVLLRDIFCGADEEPEAPGEGAQ